MPEQTTQKQIDRSLLRVRNDRAGLGEEQFQQELILAGDPKDQSLLPWNQGTKAEEYPD